MIQRSELPGRSQGTAGPLAVVTGAGISAESGVPTFRGAGGLWRNFRAEDLATPQAFARNPRLVWEWYSWRREMLSRCNPNAAHLALAALEPVVPDSMLITQNVDGLHQAAGSRRLEAIHGDIWSLRCTADGRVWQDRSVPLSEAPPRCRACGGVARPHVLWFGEAYDPAQLARVMSFLGRTALVLVIGTSGVIGSMVHLVLHAKHAGARAVEFNVEDSAITPFADEFVRGPAAETVPAYLACELGLQFST